MKFKEFWDKLTEIGWINEIPDEDLDELKEDAEAIFEREPTQAIYALSVFTFDPYCIGEADDYVDVIEVFSEGSRGLFQPENILVEEDEEEGTYSVSFDHGGENFNCEVFSDDDYMDEQVHNLINDALEDSDVDQRFFLLPPLNDMAYLVLVSADVFDRALEAGLLPEMEEEEEVDFEDEEEDEKEE